MRLKALGFLGAVGLGAMEVSHAASVKLAWKPSPDPVAGYALWYAVGGGQPARVNVGNVTNATISQLTAGWTYSFYATAHDANGNQSVPSNTITYSAPNTPPRINPVGDQIVNEGLSLNLPMVGSDAESPVTYHLTEGPTGATLDTSTGNLRWQPATSQSPSTNRFTVTVRDTANPPATASTSFTVRVRPGHFLRVSSTTGGSVQVTPRGTLNSNGDKYIYGSSVQLRAMPSTGFALKRWRINGNYLSNANPITLVMTNDHTAEAEFTVFVLAQGPLSSTQTSTASTTPTTTTDQKSLTSTPTTTTTTTNTTTSQSAPATSNTIVAPEGGLWVLQYSTDQITWTSVASGTDPNALNNLTTGRTGYYRTEQVPQGSQITIDPTWLAGTTAPTLTAVTP